MKAKGLEPGMIIETGVCSGNCCVYRSTVRAIQTEPTGYILVWTEEGFFPYAMKSNTTVNVFVR